MESLQAELDAANARIAALESTKDAKPSIKPEPVEPVDVPSRKRKWADDDDLQIIG